MRKNRIDRFYVETIDVRNSCKGSTDPIVLQQAITRVKELQDEAFDLLVDEKLAANESFRIFVTLTQDVISQLEKNLERTL